MPFRLINAPTTFQALMNEVLKPFLRELVLVLFDDILIYSDSWEAHLVHLDKVLIVLETNQLYVNQKKCIFAQTRLEYLGHIVSKEGVLADPSKIVAMFDWPTPRSIKDLRGLLGLTGYHCRFVEGYGRISWPLTQKLKRDCFHWNAKVEFAFQQLKRAMTQVPVLALPDFTQSFVVESDVSGFSIGAVLMQNQRPIIYFSQVLSFRAPAKSVYERELMAIVLAVQKWPHYLLGWRFVVRTDQ